MTDQTQTAMDLVDRMARSTDTEREKLLAGIVGTTAEPAIWSVLLSQIEEANAVLAQGGSGQDQAWFDWRHMRRVVLRDLMGLNGINSLKLLADGSMSAEAWGSNAFEQVARRYMPEPLRHAQVRTRGSAEGLKQAQEGYTAELRRQGEESTRAHNAFVQADREDHQNLVEDIRNREQLDTQIAEQIDYNDFSDSWNRD